MRGVIETSCLKGTLVVGFSLGRWKKESCDNGTTQNVAVATKTKNTLN